MGTDTRITPKLSGMDVIQAVIEEYYDLGVVQMPTQLEDTHQRRHRKMVVETEKGTFLAKTYRRDIVVLDSLRFQHHLSAHLAGNDLPVAGIKKARNGKGIVEVDNWAMELQAFVKGPPMHVTTPSLQVSADALGKFHKVCNGFPVPPRDSRKWRFSEVPRQSLQKLFHVARQMSSSNERIDDYCNQIALFLHDATEVLSAEKRKAFETGLIHGDWHGGNLLFRKGELTAILDLEFAGDGCYLEDIAYAMSNLCIRTTLSAEKMQHRANILLDAYQAYRTLTYAELVALYYAVGVKHVTTVSYQAPQMGGKVAGYTAAEWLHRLAVQCAWLAEQSRKTRWGD
ncbi:MAG: phosphotransferase [Candidatus Hydrogenedentes bacterium]|nr:phosphotransferase [Candidatus Hydrogenedentota bacterium]